MRRALTLFAFLSLTACVRLDADHCANQADPVAYCDALHQMDFCSACEASRDGCAVERPSAACEALGAAPATSSTSGVGPETTAVASSTAVADLGPGDTSAGDGTTGDPQPGCGNGIVDANENCDGDAMPYTMCSDVNLPGGNLGCHPIGSDEECRYDLSMCNGVTDCGNDVAEGMEVCDGVDLNRQTCEGLSSNYVGGTLACQGDCEAYDVNGCQLCRTMGQDCDADQPCCSGLLCGALSGTCGLL